MFFGNVAQIEITQDKNLVNKLLNDGWFLLDIRGTNAHDGVRASTECGFVFILGRGDYPRWEFMNCRREDELPTNKTV